MSIQTRIQEKKNCLTKIGEQLAATKDQALIWRLRNRQENLKMDISELQMQISG